MKTIYLDILNSMRKTTKEHYADTLWYDVNEKKMQKLSGSQIKLKYDYVNKKMQIISQPANIVVYQKVNNKNLISDWIRKNSDLVAINMEESGITATAIDVSDEHYEQVCDMLYSAGIRYR